MGEKTVNICPAVGGFPKFSWLGAESCGPVEAVAGWAVG